jgi:4-hydroxythreonine-4-phosphate dehydrogenase
MTQRPTIALAAGDPAGIGPEIVAAALADAELARETRIVALGPGALRPAGVEPLAPSDVARGDVHGWIDSGGDPATWRVGEVGAASGRAALDALRIGHELALAGTVDAFVTAPVSKQALHQAGERVEGQTELLARWCGVGRYEMLAVAGELRVMLLSRHMPLRQALECVREERVLERLELLDEALRTLFGVAAPRLALAGLNPHAGENGLLGDEDAAVIAPAVAQAAAEGIQVKGPIPAETLFVRAIRGEFDVVVAAYHDQGLVPVKLVAFGRAVNVTLGLPIVRTSVDHGTAFDIARTGVADEGSLVEAILLAARLARRS